MNTSNSQAKYVWLVCLAISFSIALLVSFNEASTSNESTEFALGLLLGALVIPLVLSMIVICSTWLVSLCLTNRRFKLSSWLNSWGLLALLLTLFLSVIGPYWIKPLVQDLAIRAPGGGIVHTGSSVVASPPMPSSQQSSADTADNNAAIAKAEAARKDADARAYLEKVLENQLNCGLPPNPSIIRIMFEQGFLRSTPHGSDGIPVLAPTIPLTLFGKRVTFMAGWGPEPDGSIKEPFSRGPGTAPPVHIAASLDALPSKVAYKQTESSDADGLPFYSHSSIEVGALDGSIAGSTITCYEGK